MLNNHFSWRNMALMVCLLVSGCAQLTNQTRYTHDSGLSFDFPDGWSILSEKEWRDMNLGENRTLVTIMDKNREAGFSLIPIGNESDMQFPSGLFGKEPDDRAIRSIESMHAAAPRKYEEYALIEKKTVKFAGLPMAELIYQGRNPGKTLKWYRVLVLAVPNPQKTLLMFVFTAPKGKQDSFQRDFAAMESSWKWQN